MEVPHLSIAAKTERGNIGGWELGILESQTTGGRCQCLVPGLFAWGFVRHELDAALAGEYATISPKHDGTESSFIAATLVPLQPKAEGGADCFTHGLQATYHFVLCTDVLRTPYRQLMSGY